MKSKDKFIVMPKNFEIQAWFFMLHIFHQLFETSCYLLPKDEFDGHKKGVYGTVCAASADLLVSSWNHWEHFLQVKT